MIRLRHPSGTEIRIDGNGDVFLTGAKDLIVNVNGAVDITGGSRVSINP